ncbi:MAG: hypothetical protein ACOCV2_10835, partial [Persicimonas sp.]
MSRKFQVLLVGAAALGVFLLAGCGGGNQCEDADCEFGECSSETGECENLSECAVSDDCLPGYECDIEGRTCEPLEECSNDGDCDTGVCEEGVCVNPDSCEDNDECLDRTYCGSDGTCQRDPCNDVYCQRGVCHPGTDQCVSADSCTQETEEEDCVAGEKCADGTCADEESFCEEIGECDRGVCSYEEGGCASADNCEGDDELCAEGEFCNDQNTCREDLCEANDVDCKGNGVCQPATGECENAEPCETHDDCVDSPVPHICIEGQCSIESQACGDADGDGGCPGNQECEVDMDEQTAECVEPSECETSIDCNDGRQCAGRVCIDAIDCRDDVYEPNESSDEATPFLEFAEDNRLRASLCENDTDVYTFNSGEIIDPSERGRLLVEVDVPNRDRGLGQLEVTLTDQDGDTDVASTGSMGEDGSVLVERGVSVIDHGEFEVEITADEDFDAAGLEYDLSVNLLPELTVDACNAAQPIEANSRVSGDTSDSDSFALDASCLEEGSNSGEVIYELELDAPQEVQFDLTPQLSSADMSMSLRGSCAQAASEVECVDEAATGGGESMTALLDEGTHYLIVQSGDEGSGGPFELTVDSVFTACSGEGDYCSDARTANLCTSDGGRFESIDCDEGCNPSSGGCYPPPGDSCLDAPVIEPGDGYEPGGDDGVQASATQERDINLAQHNNEYELPASSEEDYCMELGDEQTTRSGGADATFQLDVPPQTAVTAHVTFQNKVQGSLYMVEDCVELEDTCVGGARDSTDGDYQEKLTYTNFSEDEDETIYLVVDTAEGEAVTSADLAVTFDEVFCEPGEFQCDGSEDMEVCSDFGNEFVPHEECEDSVCLDGYCRTGDNCNRAIPIDDGETDERNYTGSNEFDPYGDGDWGYCAFTSTFDTEGN